MSSSRIYAALIITFIVTLTVEQAVGCVGILGSKPANGPIRMRKIVDEIKGNVTALCKDVEDLPQTICDAIIDPIEQKLENLRYYLYAFMNATDIAWTLHLLHVPYESIVEHTVPQKNPIIGEALSFAKDECVEELEKCVISQSCDADGNKVDLCDGLPDTVDGFCTVVIDRICDEMPLLLHPFIPYCQKYLDKWICEKI